MSEKGRIANGARKAQLRVVVSEAERAGIAGRAAIACLSISTYLRMLGLGYEPKSSLDQQTVRHLVKVNADQGRIGGLLKLWLSEHPNLGAPTTDVRRVLRDIEETQVKLRLLVQRL